MGCLGELRLCWLKFTIFFFVALAPSLSLAKINTRENCTLSMRTFFWSSDGYYLHSKNGLRIKVNKDTFACYERVPVEFKSHADFLLLALDPSHRSVSCASLREAMVAIDSVRLGIVPGPIRRGPPEVDFVDTANKLWEVKAPVSPLQRDDWAFNVEVAARSIIKELRGCISSGNSSPCNRVYVLLDTSLLIHDDRAELWDYLLKSLSDEELGRIVDFVQFPVHN